VVSLAFLIAVVACRAEAYGTKGHGLVGAIADQRLANKPIAAKLAKLLDGLTLEEAAHLADSIKAWDRKKPDRPDAWHLPDHPKIEEQLLAFWDANPPKNYDPSKVPINHHWFHYTDVPVTGKATYLSGETGRNKWDVVRMITFCIRVVQGKEPADKERKITKAMAVILLAHYLGDIHQPLHVGAMYFDDKGQPVNPDDAGGGFADNGGNALTLVLHETSDHGHASGNFNLHTYWDDNAVTTALGLYRKDIQQGKNAPKKITPKDIAVHLANREPDGWKLPDGVGLEEWSIRWADEILPAAREAHARLEFKNIHVDPKTKVARGFAVERMQNQGPSYREWAGGIVRDSIHKAGWRLAALLERLEDGLE
jgi:hypothetical protein